MNQDTLLNLADECETMSLTGDKKRIVAFDFYFLAKSKGIKYLKGDNPDSFFDYLANVSDNVDLYLICYADQIDQKGKFFQALDGAKATFNPVASFSKDQWSKFAPRYFEKRGSKIDSDACEELLRRINGDYGLFISEAGKLLSFANGEIIKKADVISLVREPLDEDAFHLYNALAKGDRKKALQLYADLKSRNEDEVGLIHLLASQFRFLSQVKFLSDRGFRSDEIASELKASPYRVSICLDNLRRLDEHAVEEALEGLYQLDKSILRGEIDPKLGFNLFLSGF